jgi:hypothetical protein
MTTTYAAIADRPAATATATATAAAPEWRVMTRRPCAARGTAVATLAAARPEGALAAAREAAAVGARKARNRKRARSRARQSARQAQRQSARKAQHMQEFLALVNLEWHQWISLYKDAKANGRDVSKLGSDLIEKERARERSLIEKERHRERCLAYQKALREREVRERKEWRSIFGEGVCDVGGAEWRRRRRRGLWKKLRLYAQHIATALHWQERTQRALCAPGCRGRIEDRAAFVSEWRTGEVVVLVDQHAASRAAERVQLAHYGATLRRIEAEDWSFLSELSSVQHRRTREFLEDDRRARGFQFY